MKIFRMASDAEATPTKNWKITLCTPTAFWATRCSASYRQNGYGKYIQLSRTAKLCFTERLRGVSSGITPASF